jgi:hypothetical protein
MDVERHLFGIGRPVLIAEAVYVLSVHECSEGVIAVGYRSLVELVASAWVRYLCRNAHSVSSVQSVFCQGGDANLIARSKTYPEVNVEVSAPSEFPIGNLERDGHLVIGMELLVEAFSRVGLEVDVVSGGKAEKGRKDER